jgi:hypothetical protein
MASSTKFHLAPDAGDKQGPEVRQVRGRRAVVVTLGANENHRRSASGPSCTSQNAMVLPAPSAPKA